MARRIDRRAKCASSPRPARKPLSERLSAGFGGFSTRASRLLATTADGVEYRDLLRTLPIQPWYRERRSPFGAKASDRPNARAARDDKNGKQRREQREPRHDGARHTCYQGFWWLLGRIVYPFLALTRRHGNARGHVGSDMGRCLEGPLSRALRRPQDWRSAVLGSAIGLMLA